MHHRELVCLYFYVVHPEEARLGLPINAMRLAGGQFDADILHMCGSSFVFDNQSKDGLFQTVQVYVEVQKKGVGTVKDVNLD